MHRVRRGPRRPIGELAGASSDVIAPPSAGATRRPRPRLDALAKPTGALGRLEDLAAWLAACQDACPPRPLERVRAVVLAGDHGVAADGVSAYPREVTAAMVRAFVAGVAAANVLARQHGVALRVLDLGVDDDLARPAGGGLGATTSAPARLDRPGGRAERGGVRRRRCSAAG